MNMIHLQPQIVWQYFDRLCAIPHPSGHLDAVREYICSVAKEAGHEVKVDEVGNLLVNIPATPGCDTAEVLVLQAHMDMVPQADSCVEHDFLVDPIRPSVVSDSRVMADRTTLGADNGIGVASMLAVMTDATLQHGPLQCLFTVDEETGMTGARTLSPDWLQGNFMINTDTEEEGVIMTGCAGAVNMTATFNYRMDTHIPDGDVAVALHLSGLEGGHSGMDIHLGRANACKLLFRFLKHAVVNFEARLAEVKAGGLRNAIPREAHAVITIPGELLADMKEEVAAYEEMYRELYGTQDPNITFTAAEVAVPKSLLPEEIQDDVINCIEACHDGVWRMLPHHQNIVETSSNLASVETDNEETRVVLLIRSMDEEMKRALASQLESTFILAGARVDFDSAYPGWQMEQNAPLLRLASETYKETFGHAPELSEVHCGLECGIIADRYPKMQIISIGPDIVSPHSPTESVGIVSVQKYWRFLCALIQNIATCKQPFSEI